MFVFTGITRQRTKNSTELHQMLKRHASQPESEDTSPMSAGTSGIGTYKNMPLKNRTGSHAKKSSQPVPDRGLPRFFTYSLGNDLFYDRSLTK